MNDNDAKRNGRMALMLAVVAVVALLPWLGLTDFNTKGEPREAVVALSMINDGNWILPENNGGDIPYKPPFFHFCIALVSLVAGGVSEFTSRLPSALSLIAMAVGAFWFFAKRAGRPLALVAGLLTLTAFEVHRAGMNCRVDMMLTAFTVGSMLLLYRWDERGHRGLPVCAVLCMSGAVLTKGPVGALLPCLVMGVFELLRGHRLLPALGRYVLCGLAACLIPALWYVAAYIQGGDRFMQLVMEENLGRMTGTMSYDSHLHPFTYNFTSILAGWAPWTLLAVVSLFFIRWKLKPQAWKVREALSRFANGDPLWLFVWTAFVVVFVFYCIPSSKRSVYLLPCYPFMAALLARYVLWLYENRRMALRVFGVAIGILGIVFALVYFAVDAGLADGLEFKGRHAAENAAMVEALAASGKGVPAILMMLLPAVAGIVAVACSVRKTFAGSREALLGGQFAAVFAIYLALDSVVLPTVMNVKSLRPMAVYIEERFSGEPLYSYISTPMMHFFGANFYLGDRIGEFDPAAAASSQTAGRGHAAMPKHGILIVPKQDRAAIMSRHPGYVFVGAGHLGQGASEVKDEVFFYRFWVSSTK